MQRNVFRFSLSLLLILFGLLFTSVSTVNADVRRQQPTVAVPTVTGTPEGAYAIVNTDQDQINVRSGPSTEYEKVGVLVAGEQVPVLGRSAQGDWIQIRYPGVEGSVAWVYSFLVTVPFAGNLPIIEPPPEPEVITPTIDPELAAQFVPEAPATRLPTFTAPAPLAIPTYTNDFEAEQLSSLPIGFYISLLGVLGLFGVVVSILRER